MELLADSLRNLWNRRLPSFLAIMGVSAGVFAFIAIGSISLHFSRISNQFEQLFAGWIVVCERPTFWAGGGILSEAKIDKALKVKGVESVLPLLVTRWSESQTVVLGIPQVVVGVRPSDLGRLAGNLRTSAGSLSLEKPGSAVTGSDIAMIGNSRPGDNITIRGKRFRIAGILERTGGIYDGQIFIPLSEAQEVFNREGLVTGLLVSAGKQSSIDGILSDMKKTLGDVIIIPPERMKTQVKSSMALWNSLTVITALISCLAGVMCIVVVMLMSVSGRVVEIGLKRAVGAVRGQIMAEFLSESVAVSLLGWFVGTVFSLVMIRVIQGITAEMGTSLFELSPELFVLSLAEALVAGILAGLYPAYVATGIEPARSLRIRY